MANSVQRLAVNGCSYMNYYAQGQGHRDLADQLQIPQAHNLAKNSVCNQRIIRTTCQDMYAATVPTLYVVGITFLARFELPIYSVDQEVEGHWQSFNGTEITFRSDDWYLEAQPDALNRYTDLYTRLFNAKHFMDDLTYRLLTMIDTAHQRGHRMLIFNTAEHGLHYWINDARFDILRTRPEIIQGLSWCSIPWQFEQGAIWPPEDEKFPWDCRHVSPGQHAHLNGFLVQYIQQHGIL